MPAHYRLLWPHHQAWLTTAVGSNNVSLVNTTFLVRLKGLDREVLKLEGFRLQIHGRA